jgi:hypothetical protein
VVEAGTGLQVQIGVDRIGDQQALTFQHPRDAPAEGVEQPCQLQVGGTSGAVEARPIVAEGVGAIEAIPGL